jgi:hypothetical protein
MSAALRRNLISSVIRVWPCIVSCTDQPLAVGVQREHFLDQGVYGSRIAWIGIAGIDKIWPSRRIDPALYIADVKSQRDFIASLAPLAQH